MFYHVAAMQFWFARASEVSIREQLVTQVILGILYWDMETTEHLRWQFSLDSMATAARCNAPSSASKNSAR